VIADLVDIAAKFWERVQTRTPPPVDASEACRDHFKERLLKADAVELVADAEMGAVMQKWHELHQLVRQGEREIDRLKNTILSTLADVGTDRIKSEVGTAKLHRSGGKETTKRVTDWKLLAELLGNLYCKTDEEWHSLLADKTTTVTTTTPLKVSLYPPKEWSK
jgi:predicted phage-related endonuclease